MVGVAIWAVCDKHILLAKRKRFPFGHYGMPGGKVEPYETRQQACRREMQEETGVIFHPADFKLMLTTEEINKPKRWHYITNHMMVEFPEALKEQVRNLEPHKQEYWGWYPVQNLPLPLMGGADTVLREHQEVLEKFYVI